MVTIVQQPIVQQPICFVCKNFDDKDKQNFNCSAYPNGIPEAILHSQHDHRKPFGKEKKDDEGKPILFDPIEDKVNDFIGEIEL